MSQEFSVLTSTSQNISRGTQGTSKSVFIESFKRIIKDVGIKLPSDIDSNILTQEQALVVRDMERALENEDDFHNFQQGLRIFCKREKHFRKALLPTMFKKSTDNGDIEIQQESLIQIFLKINRIQMDVIHILLEEITTSASEEDQDTSFLRLLLHQLRYLPYIKEPEALASKLLDVMDIGTLACQFEILNSIPEILPDSVYHETAQSLTKLLDSNEELTGAIIDCLNALSLESEIRSQVQDHILAKILAGTSVEIFPVLLDFLMTDYKAQNLNTIFFKVRNALDTIMLTRPNEEIDTEKESGKIVIFKRLQALATTPKVVSDSWISVISTIKVHTDHKPIDLLILFMLHNSVKSKKRVIEIMRKRVKDGLFRCSLLEQTFERYLNHQLLRDYFQAILEIGTSLLRSSTAAVVTEFASTLFKNLFNHKFTETIDQKEIIDSLVLLTGSSGQKNNSVILKTFLDLAENLEKLRQHTAVLMRLLEKLDSLEPKDVKLVFEILCKLTCSDESLSGFKDELHMIIRKQLSRSKRSLKHRGIITAVVMSKHVASSSVSDDQSDVLMSESSIIGLSQLRGDAKEAAALLQLTHTSTSRCPELLGLYYDQLADMLITTPDLDKQFISWLYETITNEFQNVFVTEIVSEPINEIEFSMKYNLNAKEEMESPLAVNIAELTLRPESRSVLILAPHFRLLRLLHYRQHVGNLETIDALLGCSVVLPTIETFDLLYSDQAKQTADCLFHCINWFREIISGFVKQKNRRLRCKVVQRLNDLIGLEKLLGDCLEYVPQHRLPQSYFDTISQLSLTNKEAPKTPKRPRKKFKTAELCDNTSAVDSGNKRPATKKKLSLSDDYEFNFREIDTDIVILLKYSLNFDDSLPSTEQIHLNVRQLNFILKDFCTKLALLTTGGNLGLLHLNIVTPKALVQDCTVIFPSLNRHFAVVAQRIDKLLEDTDGRHDLPAMYADEALELKTCFGLILEILALVFSWSGFQHSKRLDLLRELLQAIRSPEAQSSQSLNSVKCLSSELVGRIAGNVDRCLYVSQACNLIKIMETLYAVTPTSEIRREIAKSAGKLLGKRWYNAKGIPDSGKGSAANINSLVKAYLSSASVKTISGLVGTFQNEATSLEAKDDCLHMLASIDKSNLTIFYRCLWEALCDRVKNEIQSLTNGGHLSLWRTVAITMQGLMSVVKIHDTKLNLACFLKKSIEILKIFLKYGVPMLEITLKSKPDQVVEILKSIQTNTRYLHHLCCYSKLTKEKGLIMHVPTFRLTLEQLVYRVKAALAANNCSAAFWMGALKNRNLQGDDIMSQSSNSTRNDDENEDDEEELPADDSDEDLFDGDDEERDSNASIKSTSDVFD